MFRCTGSRLEQCTDGTWTLVQDCADDGKTCSRPDAGMPSCTDSSTTTAQPDAGTGPGCETGTKDGKCKAGSSCSADDACASEVCGLNGRCLPETCGNRTRDPEEQGTDCGGPCPACIGQSCSSDSECKTNYCEEGKCEAASCTDGKKNGYDPDLDSPCDNRDNDCDGEIDEDECPREYAMSDLR